MRRLLLPLALAAFWFAPGSAIAVPSSAPVAAVDARSQTEPSQSIPESKYAKRTAEPQEGGQSARRPARRTTAPSERRFEMPPEHYAVAAPGAPAAVA